MSQSIDTTKIFQGPCILTLGGTNLGITTDDGVRIAYARNLNQISAPQAPGPVDLRQGGGSDQAITAACTLQEVWDASTLNKLWPEVTLSGSTLKGGNIGGASLLSSALALTIHPLRLDTDTSMDLHIYKALNVLERPEFTFQAKEPVTIPVEFVSFYDSSKSDGQMLWDLGVTADSTAPTRSSTTPVDTATDQAITTTVAIVFSEAMAKGTLVDASNHTPIVLCTSADPPVFVACSAAVTTTTNTNDTITITPDASLANSTKYAVMVPEFVKDLNGNAHANSVTTFTTIAA